MRKLLFILDLKDYFFGGIGAFIIWLFYLGKKEYLDIYYGEDRGKPNRMVEDLNKWIGLAFILLLAWLLNSL